MPFPQHAKPGAPPAVHTWDEQSSWVPPACVGWHGPSKLIVALAGSFRHAGDVVDDLLTRFGAVSQMRGLRYWSVTDKDWRVLITHAAARMARDSDERRSDFTAAELKRNAVVFFEQTESRSAEPVIYSLRVIEASSHRLVIATENVTPVRVFMLTVFPPASLRATYFLQRVEPAVWSFYGLSSASSDASPLASISPPSYINRAAALYRHFIGIPTDREPPLAP